MAAPIRQLRTTEADQYLVARIDGALVRVLGPVSWPRVIGAWHIFDLARREGRVLALGLRAPGGWRATEAERCAPDWFAVRAGTDPLPAGAKTIVHSLPGVRLACREAGRARGALDPEFPVRRWGANHGYGSAAGGWVYKLDAAGKPARPVTQGWQSFAYTKMPAGTLIRLGPRHWLTEAVA